MTLLVILLNFGVFVAITALGVATSRVDDYRHVAAIGGYENVLRSPRRAVMLTTMLFLVGWHNILRGFADVIGNFGDVLKSGIRKLKGRYVLRDELRLSIVEFYKIANQLETRIMRSMQGEDESEIEPTTAKLLHALLGSAPRAQYPEHEYSERADEMHRRNCKEVAARIARSNILDKNISRNVTEAINRLLSEALNYM